MPWGDKFYRTDDERRDAGFALYSMAINGVFAGPLITGWLGDHRGWHWGFSAAAIGTTFGLVQYVLGRRRLARRKHAAEFAPDPDAMRRAIRPIVTGLVSTATIAVLLAAAGRLPMDRFVDLLTLVSVIAIGVALGGLSFLLMALPTSGHSSDAASRGLRRTMHPVH